MYKAFIYTSDNNQIRIVGKFQEFKVEDNNLSLEKGLLDSSFKFKQYNRKVNVAIPQNEGRKEYHNIEFSEPFRNNVIKTLTVDIENIKSYDFEETTEEFVKTFDKSNREFEEFVQPSEATDLY